MQLSLKRRLLVTVLLTLFFVPIIVEFETMTIVAPDSGLNGYSDAIHISGASLGATTPVKLAYGYYTVNPYQQVAQETCVKPVILNNHRYIFVDSGWGAGHYDSIKAYTADVNWNRVSLVATTLQTNYDDFYTASFPEVWRDLIVIYGTTSNGAVPTGGEVQAFNITSNRFQNLTVNPHVSYVTGIYWVPAHNEFLLSMYNVIGTATPTTLFNYAQWTTNFTTAVIKGGGGEMRQAYLSADDCSYFGFIDNNSNFGVVMRWNLTSGVISNAFQTAYNANSAPYSGQYTSSNSTTVFQTFNNGTFFHYYYSNDGNNWTNFAQLPIVAQGFVWTGVSERHGSVLPIYNNQILLGNCGDGNTASYFALSNTETGAIIEKYYTNSHTDAGAKLVFDQNNTEIIIGGEGAPIDGSHPIILSIGLGYKASSDFTNINFCKSDKATPLNFNRFNVVNNSYAEFAVDTSSITGNNSFYLYFGKAGQTFSSKSSVYEIELPRDNAGLQFDTMESLNLP